MELKAEVQLKTNCSSLSASSRAERSTCNGLQAGFGSVQSMGSPPYLSRQTGAVSANSFGKQHPPPPLLLQLTTISVQTWGGQFLPKFLAASQTRWLPRGLIAKGISTLNHFKIVIKVLNILFLSL